MDSYSLHGKLRRRAAKSSFCQKEDRIGSQFRGPVRGFP
jgi:hypothetical protein